MEITILDPEATQFDARIVTPLGVSFAAQTVLKGRFEITADHVHTGMML